LGADDYIIKPFRARELLATVRNHLAKQAALNCNFQDKSEDLVRNGTFSSIITNNQQPTSI